MSAGPGARSVEPPILGRKARAFVLVMGALFPGMCFAIGMLPKDWMWPRIAIAAVMMAGTLLVLGFGYAHIVGLLLGSRRPQRQPRA